jgi:tetratricopeptide (TPR) repeat protein
MLRYLIVFLICGPELLAQDPDTLLNRILLIQNDTEKVNQLYTTGFDLIDKDPQLAYTYAVNCESSAQKTRSPKHISKSLNLSGILFLKQGYYKRSLQYFERYMAAAKAMNDPAALGIAYRNLGNIYLRLEEFEKAEYYWLLALEHYNKLNNKTEVANELINLGVLKHEQNQLDAAFRNYEKALETGKELNNYEIKEICLNNMAQIFFDQGNYEKALAYNYEALELRDLMGLDVDKTDSYLSIAEIALQQKDLALAEENLKSALKLCKELDYLEGKVAYHKLASELFEQKKDYRSAYENLKLHGLLNDSLLSLNEEEPVLELKENAVPIPHLKTASVPNLWLLSLLSLFLVIIPFVLIRYKR